jgi:NTE family protein
MFSPMVEQIDQPASLKDRNTTANTPQEGIALCLSGGGYRAMLFHLGALIRLNAIGMLSRLSRISSVSGGSITAAWLGLQWQHLSFDSDVATNLGELVVNPIRKLADHTIDIRAIIVGLLRPGTSITDALTAAFRRHLFGDATLQDFPEDGLGPRFVINATNVQTGALWRFSKPFMGDYKVGLVMNPSVSLARAVSASSAFPPFLSPLMLNVPEGSFTHDTTAQLQIPPFITDVYLSDGGVYDNLALETAWKRYTNILISDAGLKMPPQPNPKRDWPRHSLRINEVIDNQVRSLRKRQVIAAFQADERGGAYWGIRSHVEDFPARTSLDCPVERTVELAQLPTRLGRVSGGYQDRLINWGYAICASATESHFPGGSAPITFPYPGGI